MLDRHRYIRELGLSGLPGTWTSEGFIPETEDSVYRAVQVQGLLSQVGKRNRTSQKPLRRSDKKEYLTTE